MADQTSSTRFTRAFSLIELLVALAVAAVVAGMAYPAFNDLIARVHATSRVNDLVGIIRFARHAAIDGGRWVTLCPATDEICTNRDEWQSGIMVFADHNRDGARATGGAGAWLSGCAG